MSHCLSDSGTNPSLGCYLAVVSTPSLCCSVISQGQELAVAWISDLMLVHCIPGISTLAGLMLSGTILGFIDQLPATKVHILLDSIGQKGVPCSPPWPWVTLASTSKVISCTPKNVDMGTAATFVQEIIGTTKKK